MANDIPKWGAGVPTSDTMMGNIYESGVSPTNPYIDGPNNYSPHITYNSVYPYHYDMQTQDSVTTDFDNAPYHDTSFMWKNGHKKGGNDNKNSENYDTVPLTPLKPTQQHITVNSFSMFLSLVFIALVISLWTSTINMYVRDNMFGHKKLKFSEMLKFTIVVTVMFVLFMWVFDIPLLSVAESEE